MIRLLSDLVIEITLQKIDYKWNKICSLFLYIHGDIITPHQRPSTKLLSIGRQITGRFCWNYDEVHFSFSKIHPIGNRLLPATHIWLVQLNKFREDRMVVSVWLGAGGQAETNKTINSFTAFLFGLILYIWWWWWLWIKMHCITYSVQYRIGKKILSSPAKRTWKNWESRLFEFDVWSIVSI